MLLSGVTHVAQLAVYEAEGHVVGAATFGAIYFVIGLLLLGRSRLALWLGAILPSIGGVGGILRYAFVHPNPFSLFHVGIDLVVVPICAVLIWRRHDQKPAPSAADKGRARSCGDPADRSTLFPSAAWLRRGRPRRPS